MKINNFVMLVALFWITLISTSFFWNYKNAVNEQERIALQSSRSFLDHIVITRLWNASHGGLYVPVTDKTLPNSYLDDQMRDIEVNENFTLTKVNPAFMTRQISEIANEQGGVRFHITSLNPIRPQNKPTKIEVKFLKEFENGVKEKGLLLEEESGDSYFYMAPLETKKPCLKCHAKQGYKVGDVRGGISISLPFIMKIPLVPLLLWHSAIGLIGLFGIIIAGRKLEKSYEIIKEQAVIDALTGVPNRRSFSESIFVEFKSSQRHKQPLSIIMCDVDNFKSYNDYYGHGLGDKCLRRIAQTVKSSLTRPGDFCARYGGEEFVILLPNTPLEGAMHVAKRIKSNVERMGIPHKKSLPAQVVTLSLGVTTSEVTSLVSPEELIKQADMALYDAKNKGRNQAQFFSINS